MNTMRPNQPMNGQSVYRKPLTTPLPGSPNGVASAYPGPIQNPPDYVNNYQSAMERRLKGYQRNQEMPIDLRSSSGARMPDKITLKTGGGK